MNIRIERDIKNYNQKTLKEIIGDINQILKEDFDYAIKNNRTPQRYSCKCIDYKIEICDMFKKELGWKMFEYPKNGRVRYVLFLGYKFKYYIKSYKNSYWNGGTKMTNTTIYKIELEAPEEILGMTLTEINDYYNKLQKEKENKKNELKKEQDEINVNNKKKLNELIKKSGLAMEEVEELVRLYNTVK